ncbi:unnamed protein product [Pocillopora meandrina]|uniref:Uncharacterized protein n=1 Tax=Pocillopora meandrina TaxID=46732 RepID=A0AAU9XJ59_9CNID|nr:unnamed protein product [Pocillopora meandrina]
MYRKDRKNGGGGLLAYFSSALPSKKRSLPKTYKTLEAIAVEKYGVYQREMSDHHMVFGEMMEKVHKHKTRTTTFQQTKSTDCEQLNRDLEAAPWHVGEIFCNVNDQYDYWKGLFESVVDQHAPTKKKQVREKDIP